MKTQPVTANIARLAVLSLLILGVGTLNSTRSVAAPQVPSKSDQVLARVEVNPATRELRAAVAREPANIELVARLTQHHIELARANGDPRHLGRAEAVLASWSKQNDPGQAVPATIRVLRATLAQSNHDFDRALAELDQALAQRPDDAQAWLTRATILTVRADYTEATRSCQRLLSIAGPALAATCLAGPYSLSGRAETAYIGLERLALRAGAEPEFTRWARTLAAEIAARRGDARAAEQHFRAALALGAEDVYLRAAFADFLLDQRRAGEARELLRDHTRADALLLRLAIAEKTLGSADAVRHRAALAARFDAARARGDTTHQREEARFALAIEGDARRALGLARSNWQVQREPADARVLLEAASASGDRAAAQPVKAWLETNRVEDVVLRRLASGL